MILSVFDIDGTLTRPGQDWPRPHSLDTMQDAMRVMDPCRVAQDTPTADGVAQWCLHQLMGPCVILTGRAMWSADITLAWLNYHGYSSLVFMRWTDDLRQSHEIKREYLEAAHERVIVIDDDTEVGKICKELGHMFIDAKEFK